MAGLGLGLLSSAAPTTGYAVKSAAVMTNGQTIFTVTGGPILIQALASLCVTANNATASTLQYSVTPAVGTTTAICLASASLANAAAGASVSMTYVAGAATAFYSATGPNVGLSPATLCPAGTITMVIGTGSTTGTWQHHLYYWALGDSITVS